LRLPARRGSRPGERRRIGRGRKEKEGGGYLTLTEERTTSAFEDTSWQTSIRELLEATICEERERKKKKEERGKRGFLQRGFEGGPPFEVGRSRLKGRDREGGEGETIHSYQSRGREGYTCALVRQSGEGKEPDVTVRREGGKRENKRGTVSF